MLRHLLALFLLGCQSAAIPFPRANEGNTAFPTQSADSQRSIPGTTLLIRNANVIDGTGAPARAGYDILIVDGKIAAYAAGITAPDGTPILDASGKTVLPGLIDAHAHTQSVPGAMLRGDSAAMVAKQQELQLRAYLASGVTTLLDAAISRPTVERFRALERAGAPMPTVHHLSPFLTPRGGYFGTDTMRGETYADLWTPAADAAAIKAHISAAVDLRPVGVKVTVEDGMVIPVWPLFDSTQIDTIKREAAAAGTPIFVHSMTNREHRTALTLAPYALVHTGLADEELEPDVLQSIKASNAYVISTLVVYPMAGWLWNPATMRQPWIEALVPRVQWETALHPRLLDRSLDVMTPQNAPAWVPNWLARLAAPYLRSASTSQKELESSMRAVRSLHEAGVPIVMGADAGNWPAFATYFHGVGSLLEMELLEKAGLPRSEVIVAATSRAARMLNQAKHIGTIAPGLDADLIIVPRNPLDHGMQTLQDVQWVIKRGRAKTPAAWLHD